MYVHACCVPFVFLEHGALGISKSPVSTYNFGSSTLLPGTYLLNRVNIKTDFDSKNKKDKKSAGWQKRKRALGYTRKSPERSRQHTQYNVRISRHSKPSRTPGNVSHTVLYDAIFLPHWTACADFNYAGEADV